MEDRYALIPIDHGYCLPSRLLINEIDWAWFYYPQVDRPVNEEIKKYLKELDLEALLREVLQQVSLSRESIFLSRISHQLVVGGVASGLTLYDIAMIVARVKDDVPSPLERAINEAEENAHRTIEMRLGAISRSLMAEEYVKKEEDHRIKSMTKGHYRKRVSSHVIARSHYLSPHKTSENDRSLEEGDPPLKARCKSLSEASVEPLNECQDIIATATFNFKDPRSSIDELTGGTDSSGTNTPQHRGSSTPESLDNFDDQCILNGQRLEGLNIINDMPIQNNLPFRSHMTGEGQHAHTSRRKKDRKVKSISPLRLAFADVDEGLERRMCSPGSSAFTSPMDKDGPSIHSRTQSEDLYLSEMPLSSLSGGRLKRVSTLNQVALPDTASRSISLCIPHTSNRKISYRNAQDLSNYGGKGLTGGGESDSRNNGGNNTTDDLDITDTDGNGSPLISPLSSPTSVSTPPEETSFLRVTSFSAFSSAPIFDAEDAERRTGKLRKERRRQVATTDEFLRLRLQFARYAVTTLISKTMKSKG
jgi:hypothetical protein